MKKILFSMLSLVIVFTGCSKEELLPENGRPHKDGKCSVTIEELTDEGGTLTRATLTEGTATGDGLNDGQAKAIVTATANAGYRLVTFEGGKVGESAKALPKDLKSASYNFRIENYDWKFRVKFAKEYRIDASGEHGSVTGSGMYLEGENCTLTAKPDEGYTFDGWYENGAKVSSENPWKFTVSSGRTKYYNSDRAVRQNIILKLKKITY